MLDHPDKTTKLLAALKTAVPFEVELTEWLVKRLRAQHHAGADQKHHTVSDLSYAGDEGGTSSIQRRCEGRFRPRALRPRPARCQHTANHGPRDPERPPHD